MLARGVFFEKNASQFLMISALAAARSRLGDGDALDAVGVGDVALQRQHLQIEHQLHVLGERIRDAGRRPGLHQIAGGHQRVTHPPGNGRADPGPLQIETRGLHRGFGHTDLCPALGLGAGPAIKLFPGDGLRIHQPAAARTTTATMIQTIAFPFPWL